MSNAPSSPPFNARQKIEMMIEELEPAGEREICGSHFHASGYLLALHDLGLLTDKEWTIFDHLIDMKCQAPKEGTTVNNVGG